jgi:hypothetical protein
VRSSPLEDHRVSRINGQVAGAAEDLCHGRAAISGTRIKKKKSASASESSPQA